MENSEALVSGKIHFPDDTPAFSDAVLIVKLEDVSLMDAPAENVISHSTELDYSGRDSIEFALPKQVTHENSELQVFEIRGQANYNLRVHVSLHSDDGMCEIRKGDFITTQSYPVLTKGHPNTIEVELKRV